MSGGRMNILIYAGSLAHTQAGAAHATLDFTNALAASTPHRVYLYATEVDRETIHPAVEVISYERPQRGSITRRFRHLVEVGQHVRELRRRRLPDVDLCYTQGLVWALAFRRFRPQVPIVSHTGAVISERERIEEQGGAHCPWHVRLDAKVLTRKERNAYREPNWAHVVSTRIVARQRAEFYGVSEDTFHVVPYGLDLDKFNRERSYADVRPELGIPPDAVVVVTVSRLIRWKNTDRLLRAFARAAEANPCAWMLVVGDGSERPRLEALARELGIAERTRFPGHAADPAPYYAASDVFALPSQIESFGIVYAEAMLLGLPCIGSRNAPPDVLSSAEDVIVEGQTGFCVATEAELADRLARLIGNSALRETMGAAGYARAKSHYSCEAYTSSMLTLARSTLGLEC